MPGAGGYALAPLLAALLIAGGGCKFREPDPSPDVYAAATAAGKVRPPLAPMKGGPVPPSTASHPDVPVGGDLLARFLARKSDSRGFMARAPSRTIAYRSGEYVRVDEHTGRVAGVKNGVCWLRAGKVVHPCTAADRATLLGEARAAAVLHGAGLEARKDVTLAGVTVTVGVGDQRVVATLDSDTATIRALVGGPEPGSPVLTDIVRAKRKSPPTLELFGVSEQVIDGLREIVIRPERHVLCASHVGGLDGVVGVTRRLQDQLKAAGLRHDPLDGFIADLTAPKRWRICLTSSGAGPGTVAEPSRAIARLWHHGPVEGLLARQGDLESYINAKARKKMADARLRAVLYTAPGVGAPADRISCLELVLEAQ